MLTIFPDILLGDDMVGQLRQGLSGQRHQLRRSRAKFEGNDSEASTAALDANEGLLGEL
jgi:hypothetical protein